MCETFCVDINKWPCDVQLHCPALSMLTHFHPDIAHASGARALYTMRKPRWSHRRSFHAKTATVCYHLQIQHKSAQSSEKHPGTMFSNHNAREMWHGVSLMTCVCPPLPKQPTGVHICPYPHTQAHRRRPCETWTMRRDLNDAPSPTRASPNPCRANMCGIHKRHQHV